MMKNDEVPRSLVREYFRGCQHGVLKPNAKFFLLPTPTGYSLVEGKIAKRTLATGKNLKKEIYHVKIH